ncbi:TPA: hypothetical protein UM790_001946 [Stenotrophomonas maltophilia]|nr:hypothetical protein [Stenotrophomonas maltophilia]
MNATENHATTKEIIRSGEHKDIHSALSSNKDKAIDIISDLISSNGFTYIETNESNESIEFRAGHENPPNNTIITFEKADCTIHGTSIDTIEKTYLIAFAIENYLDDAIYLPHELRQARIKAVIADYGVDVQFYSNVLRNW